MLTPWEEHNTSHVCLHACLHAGLHAGLPQESRYHSRRPVTAQLHPLNGVTANTVTGPQQQQADGWWARTVAVTNLGSCRSCAHARLPPTSLSAIGVRARAVLARSHTVANTGMLDVYAVAIL